MDIFSIIPYDGEDLSIEFRNLDSTRSLEHSTAMTPTGAFGEYQVSVTVGADPANPGVPAEDLFVGSYYVRIYNDAGTNRKIGYVRIVSATEYHFVSEFGDLLREPSAAEIDAELDDEHDELIDEINENQPPQFEID